MRLHEAKAEQTKEIYDAAIKRKSGTHFVQLHTKFCTRASAVEEIQIDILEWTELEFGYVSFLKLAIEKSNTEMLAHTFAGQKW